MTEAAPPKLSWLAAVLLSAAMSTTCASTRTVTLRPEPHAQSADTTGFAPNRPAFGSVTILAPAGLGSDATL
jgi:hypothetical protein